MIKHVIIVIILIFLFGYTAYTLKKKRIKDLTISDFLLGKHHKLKTILVGLIFGIIFGFLDNYYLYSGITVFKNILPKNKLLKAGWGNTYSDFIGATMGTFIGVISIEYFNVDNDEIPIWVNTLGIFIGCLLGMYIPHYFLAKK